MTQILPFLTDLAENNNRPWFEANKKRYTAALEEYTQIVTDALAEMGKLGMPVQEGVTAKDCIMRIYRDVRFSTDKSPYKKNMGGSIGPAGRKGVGPMVYLHVQPGESFLAFGMYQPEADRLKALRQEIDFNYNEFKGLMDEPAFKSFWGDVQGESLKTLPKGYDAANPAIDFLKKKEFFFVRNLTQKETNERIIPKLAAEGLKLSIPLYEFFSRTRVGDEAGWRS